MYLVAFAVRGNLILYDHGIRTGFKDLIPGGAAAAALYVCTFVIQEIASAAPALFGIIDLAHLRLYLPGFCPWDGAVAGLFTIGDFWA
jgi:hypothetical protein